MKGLTKRYPLQPRVSYTQLKPGEDRTNPVNRPACGNMPAINEQAPPLQWRGRKEGTEMNPTHHISVHPETRRSDGDEGPLVFHFIPKEKTSPDGWKALCGAFIPDNAKTIRGGGTQPSVICPLCALVLQLGEDRRDAPHWSSRYKTADRFIKELTIINKLGKEQQ